MFLVGIDLEYFKTYFKTKNSKSKFFPCDFLFSAKITKIVKMTVKKFWSKKIFGSESIQHALKRILQQNSQNRKFFPL